jgi:hypothetical protein
MACDIIGYLASTMVFLTFVSKDVRLLRILAIVSNVAFFAYGLLAWLPPVFCLHLMLLPINTLRLREILQTQGCPIRFSWLRMLATRFYPALQTGPHAVV